MAEVDPHLTEKSTASEEDSKSTSTRSVTPPPSVLITLLTVKLKTGPAGVTTFLGYHEGAGLVFKMLGCGVTIGRQLVLSFFDAELQIMFWAD